MVNFMVFSLFMVVLFLMLVGVSGWLYFSDLMVILEWAFCSVNSVNMELIILVDWVSLLFISFVLLISSMIFFYSCEYMYEEVNLSRFLWLMLLFIFSMVMMILSPNIISILFGWDGLGLVSYCLVIYYQSYSSFNSGMVTVLSNRVGDVGLLISVGMMVSYGSWNIWAFSSPKVMGLIILAAVTKSAQIPFSSWLPMAMAAPTPVSALVHSSTLVTAGVYLLIRFNGVMMSCNEIYKVLMILSVLTVIISGAVANFESDLKKVIALSTLSQLGLMMFSLSLGGHLMAFYHLLVHALFKSMMFMCAGIMIHLMSNKQDIRSFGSLNSSVPFVMMMFYIANFALCGAPFMSGFYSKDLIMEMVYMSGLSMVIVFMSVLGLMMTVMYSFRLFYMVFFGEGKMTSFNFIKEGGIMNFSVIVLGVSSIVSGSVLNWLFFWDFYLFYMSPLMKLMTLSVCGGSIIVSGSMINLMSQLKIWVGNNKVKGVSFMVSMFFLNSFLQVIYKPFNEISGSMVEVDKVWVEQLTQAMIFSFVKDYMKFGVNLYGIYMIMYVIIGSLVLVYLII